MSHHSARDAVAPVAIVGGGPVGLSLALGLARHGVRSVLFERKPTTSEHSKAPGIHVRTREVFRHWGVEGRFLEAGVLKRSLTLHSALRGRRPFLSMDFAELDAEADRAGILILEQGQTERLLLEAVRESGFCDLRFGADAVALTHGADGVSVTVRQDGAEQTLDAEFVVGCDGAKSFVRDALRLPFEGTTYAVRPVLADVRVEDARDSLPWPRAWNGPGGYSFALRLRAGVWRIVRLERSQQARREDVPDQEVRDRVGELLGPGPIDVIWASRFRIHLRSSPRFRVGRVLLAGDAAHVHSPAGGLGMNGGIHDAHNLAWKLGAALDGGDVDRLLDSFEVERRAVIVERVSRYTDLVTRVFLNAPAIAREAAFVLVRQLLRSARRRRMNLRSLAMLDLDYPASPLLDARVLSAGVRLPNPVLRSPDGTTIRLYDLLPAGPVLLDVAEDRQPHADLPVASVIRIGARGHQDATGLLRGLLGGRDGWILVRPDAHVAWARHGPDGMEEATRHALGQRP